MKDNFVSIKNFENYKISPLGVVYSVKNKMVLKPFKRNGYLSVFCIKTGVHITKPYIA